MYHLYLINRLFKLFFGELFMLKNLFFFVHSIFFSINSFAEISNFTKSAQNVEKFVLEFKKTNPFNDLIKSNSLSTKDKDLVKKIVETKDNLTKKYDLSRNFTSLIVRDKETNSIMSFRVESYDPLKIIINESVEFLVNKKNIYDSLTKFYSNKGLDFAINSEKKVIYSKLETFLSKFLIQKSYALKPEDKRKDFYNDMKSILFVFAAHGSTEPLAAIELGSSLKEEVNKLRKSKIIPDKQIDCSKGIEGSIDVDGSKFMFKFNAEENRMVGKSGSQSVDVELVKTSNKTLANYGSQKNRYKEELYQIELKRNRDQLKYENKFNDFWDRYADGKISDAVYEKEGDELEKERLDIRSTYNQKIEDLKRKYASLIKYKNILQDIDPIYVNPFGVYLKGFDALFHRSKNQIDEAKNKIDKIKNSLKEKYKLEKAINLNDKFELEAVPTGSAVTSEELAKYKASLVQETNKLRDLQEKYSKLQKEELLKLTDIIYSLKAISKCCSDNNCRADFVNYGLLLDNITKGGAESENSTPTKR